MEQTSHIAHAIQGPIEYIIQGKGEMCLLLHGGHSNYFERFGTDAVDAADMSALIPSHPGYGRTPAHVGKTASSWRASLRVEGGWFGKAADPVRRSLTSRGAQASPLRLGERASHSFRPVSLPTHL